MDRTSGPPVGLAVAVATAAGTFWLLGTTAALAIALGVTVGALASLSVANPDHLLYGRHPWPVARWGGAAAGFTLAVAMLVYVGVTPGLGSGERYGLAILVLGTTWAGVGFGVALTRADVATETE